MTEVDVALTDFALAVECGAFALASARRARTPVRDALAGVFALTSVASLLGGVVHGFASDPASMGYRVLWPTILLAIIAASVASSFAALELFGAGRTWFLVVWTGALVFGVAVLAGAQSFGVAVAAYAPASFTLAYAFADLYRRTKDKRAACGTAGLLLAIGAGGLQQLEATPFPGLLSPDAFYHLLQMLALALLFSAGSDYGPVRAPTAA